MVVAELQNLVKEEVASDVDFPQDVLANLPSSPSPTPTLTPSTPTLIPVRKSARASVLNRKPLVNPKAPIVSSEKTLSESVILKTSSTGVDNAPKTYNAASNTNTYSASTPAKRPRGRPRKTDVSTNSQGGGPKEQGTLDGSPCKTEADGDGIKDEGEWQSVRRRWSGVGGQRGGGQLVTKWVDGELQVIKKEKGELLSF
jgi:hypothetical protein